jgi:hypothetical protein
MPGEQNVDCDNLVVAAKAFLLPCHIKLGLVNSNDEMNTKNCISVI